ncbi:MAG TPA: hypothetical protein VFM12_07360 [Gemmatimonadales bacterium]|nr:hypothetical protein [Gemmatimonadales bacterium]
MSNTLPQAFFATLMVVALALMGRAAIHTNARMYQSQVVQAKSAYDAARASVRFGDVTPGATNDDIVVELQNDGKRDLADWAQYNVIAVYETASGSITEALAYTEDGPAGGQWSVLAGAGEDVYQPGILNLDETIELSLKLGSVPEPGSVLRLLFTLDGGMTFTTVVSLT